MLFPGKDDWSELFVLQRVLCELGGERIWERKYFREFSVEIKCRHSAVLKRGG